MCFEVASGKRRVNERSRWCRFHLPFDIPEDRFTDLQLCSPEDGHARRNSCSRQSKVIAIPRLECCLQVVQRWPSFLHPWSNIYHQGMVTFAVPLRGPYFCPVFHVVFRQLTTLMRYGRLIGTKTGVSFHRNVPTIRILEPPPTSTGDHTMRHHPTSKSVRFPSRR